MQEIKALPCQQCKSHKIDWRSFVSAAASGALGFRYYCTGCGFEGQPAENLELALGDWNQLWKGDAPAETTTAAPKGLGIIGMEIPATPQDCCAECKQIIGYDIHCPVCAQVRFIIYDGPAPAGAVLPCPSCTVKFKMVDGKKVRLVSTTDDL